MATQPAVKEERFSLARAYLAERGVTPTATGEYDTNALIDAIRDRGYEATIERTGDEWTVYFRDLFGSTPSRHEFTIDADPTTALLDALDIVVTWMTPEEEHQYFDEQARKYVGMSGREFLRRWDAGELDPEDPTVRQLRMIRPLDW